MSTSTSVGHARFVGSVPEYYERYLAPLLFAPYAQDLACRVKIGPTSRILELAAELADREPRHTITMTEIDHVVHELGHSIAEAVEQCRMCTGIEVRLLGDVCIVSTHRDDIHFGL